MAVSSNVKLARLRRLLTAVNCGLVASYLGLWLIGYFSGLAWSADFSMFYTGGVVVREGSGNRVYDLELQSRYQHEILDGRSFADGLLPFNYPPYVALLSWVFSLAPRETSYAVWGLVQLGFAIWIARRLSQLTANWSRSESRLLLSTVFAFPPFLFTLVLGSFSLLLLVCWLEAYYQLVEDSETRAGLSLAVGALKPQSVLAFGLAILGAKRWRILAVVASVGAGVFLCTTLILGATVWRDFASIIIRVGSLYDEMGIVLTDMHNFKAVLAGVLGAEEMPLINALSLSAFAASSLWTLWVWRGQWLPGAPAFDLKLAVTCGLGLFFSPHLYPQDSLLWVFPAFLGYRYLRVLPRPLRAYSIFLLTWPILFLVDEFSSVRICGVRPAVVLPITLLSWLSVLLVGSTAGGDAV